MLYKAHNSLFVPCPLDKGMGTIQCIGNNLLSRSSSIAAPVRPRHVRGTCCCHCWAVKDNGKIMCLRYINFAFFPQLSCSFFTSRGYYLFASPLSPAAAVRSRRGIFLLVAPLLWLFKKIVIATLHTLCNKYDTPIHISIRAVHT